ncbi:thymidylate kinase [Pirellula staleyi DSM 6068]|uniref:Thymidylate kinase n=1 Tax=Pirellula staleyi (strain ATCC 27377 / DSM 6068 / ICPB 4128) TaxID=530564 RepID=D2R1Q2_PIRSD|nr:dTMP kinase [Pirellula staleyi]ADB16771.1 thymidylate kinase [Pirellula staleyi DSM 6068]
MFLSFDGVDGAGKSTQIRLLAEWLAARSLEVVVCRDPGGTPLGEKLRSILLDDHETPIHRRSEMLLFMASRAQLVEEVIRPALEAGKVVISDRFLLATAVYQAHAGGLVADDVWTVGKVAVGGMMPARVLLLDMPAAEASKRIARAHDRMESQGLAYLERVRQGFLLEAERDPQTIRAIDAARDPQAVHADVVAAVEPLLLAREPLR